MMSFYRRWDFSSLCLLLEFLTVGLLVCASVILTCTTWCKAVGWQPECLMIAECERGCLSSLARGTEKLCHSSVDKRSRGSRRTNTIVNTSWAEARQPNAYVAVKNTCFFSFFMNHCWFTLWRMREFLAVATAPDTEGLETRLCLIAA